MTINASMGLREWTLLVILSILWGGSFFFIEVAVTQIPPLTLVSLRVLLAAAVLWAVAGVMRVQVPGTPYVWFAFGVMGLMNNVIPFSLIAWGQTHIASGLASILNATTPLFTVLIAGALLDDERVSPMKLIGVVIGFCGVALMLRPSLLLDVENELVAQLAVLIASISYAFAGVFGRRFKRMGIAPIVIALGQLTVSSALLTPVALLIEQPMEQLQQTGLPIWSAIMGLAMMSTALAYIIYFRLLASAGATNLLLVTFLIPVSAILLGSIFLAESLETIHFIGMLMIGIGLSAIDGRLWRIRRQPG